MGGARTGERCEVRVQPATDETEEGLVVIGYTGKAIDIQILLSIEEAEEHHKNVGFAIELLKQRKDVT